MSDSCNVEMDVTLFAAAHPSCTDTLYKLQNISSCLDTQVPNLVGSGGSCCVWPTTVTVKPVPLPINDANVDKCFWTMLKGFPEGTVSQCLAVPYLGAPIVPLTPEATSCGCQDKGDCGCDCSGGSGCGCGGAGPPRKMSLPAQKFRCINPAPPASGGAAVPGNGISQASQLVKSTQSLVHIDIPDGVVGPGYLNIANGNLVVLLDHPAGGPFDPTPVLVYNSRNATGANSEYGFGWTELHKNKVSVISPAKADVTDGLGTVLHYTCKPTGTTAGTYRPPGACQSGLARNGDGTWDQTLPDGFKLHYNSSGALTYFADTSNDRWTVIYDNSQRISAINNPFGLWTTYSYASNKIRRVQDGFGRISTFTVDCPPSRNACRSSGLNG
jgi:hypothetical protein